jgi:hypothetical protein
MNEAEVPAFNLLKPGGKVSLRILRVQGLSKIIRNIVSQPRLSARRFLTMHFHEIGKGSAGGYDPIFIGIKVPWRTGLEVNGKGQKAVPPPVSFHDLVSHMAGLFQKILILSGDPVSKVGLRGFLKIKQQNVMSCFFT